jgi:putative SOS response-associated peptidase YedK
MCGRFTYRLTWPELRLYRLPLDTPARNTQPRYNVCPTDPIDVVTERDDMRELVSMRWGLVPFLVVEAAQAIDSRPSTPAPRP